MSGDLHEPEGLAPHGADYKPDAWMDWTLYELGWWVHLLTKRAGMRADPHRRAKDLHDAANYQAMAQAFLDAARERHGC
jgi:hypothetical protein